MKICRILPLALCVALLLSGCFLLPQEAEVPSLPLVETEPAADYKTVVVQRGDIALTASVSFSYVPLQQEELSFAVGGERYGGIYVQTGDAVAVGDLMAELDCSDLDREIQELNEQLSTSTVQLEYARQALTAAESIGGETAQQYREKAAQLEDDVYVLGLRLEELEQQKDQRRLYASIDGTVTYVKSIGPSSTTIKGSTVVTVANREQSIFAATTEYYDLFQPGDKLTVTIGDQEYETVVKKPQELDFEPYSTEDKGVYKEKVYLVITDENAYFESSSIKASAMLVLDSREDVLWLQSRAVVTIGGQSMVYYQDDTGLRSAKAVETGITADEGIEIVSGLEEGDVVIIGGSN